MSRFNRIYREDGGRFISGAILQAFIHNGGTYFLVGVRVYQDGMVDDWGAGVLMPLDEFKRKVRSGWVVTHLPEGARVAVSSMPIWFTATDAGSAVDLEDFLAQVEDEIRALNGQPTTSDICCDAFAAYLREPSDAARERLWETYEAVPQHRRIFLGDQDTKDSAIRDALGYTD